METKNKEKANKALAKGNLYSTSPNQNFLKKQIQQEQITIENINKNN
ncbi:MAG: hypothetical protein CM15mV67_430 [uncultured marine virus]|nr:MAG: hypothetical protein CM15mV67_430 [uncultured marine virus]